MSAWKETHRGVVFPWHCDHYGHFSARWYVHLFADAGYHLWTVNGCSHRDMRARGVETIVAHYAVDYLQEMLAGDLLVIESGFQRLGTKSVTHVHRMSNADTGIVTATAQCVEVFSRRESGGTFPIPEDVRSLLETQLVDAHPR